MIPVLSFLTSFVLAAVLIATFGWVFYRTRVWVAIANIVYLLLKWLFLEGLVSRTINAIQTDEALPWLGAISGERVSNFLFLSRLILDGIETGLLIWLLLTLTRRTRRI